MWDRTILLGQWLFVACCMAYLVWWCVAFRPGYSAPMLAKLIPFALTAMFGITGLGFIVSGCNGAKQIVDSAVSNVAIIGACAALYIVLLLATNLLMHRQVTTELLLIVFWIGMELCIIRTMYGGGCWSFTAALVLAIIAVIVAAAGMICYLQYYNLEPMKAFYAGMAPLILFAAYMAGISIYQIAT